MTSTGLRPYRSIARPATAPVSAAATRKIAGPSPRSPLTPVTRTNVSDETAATSCTTAEFTASVAASRTVFRRTTRSRSSRGTRASVSRNGGRAAVRRMADVRRAERRLGDPADREHAAAAGELAGERQRGLTSARVGARFDGRGAGVGRARRSRAATSSSSPSSARTRWTIVAVASRRPARR